MYPPVVQPPVMAPPMVPALGPNIKPGNTYRFTSANCPNNRLKHIDYTCKAYEWGNDDETSWNIIDRDDNGDGGFSFQSTNCPHLFIYRNGENNVVIHENNGEWTWEDQIWYSIPYDEDGIQGVRFRCKRDTT